ncbi:Protein of unknown function [Haloechinothrix alba]|uniref:DUF3093 domain-containing protein n=1 Tax=Haloechinothrix alba TaxID=664784 RepID=A0A238X705_9PSEU|nr:DUF3093 domain-containing protein [Haloechinothrix alba]SNR54333.1 Protein of unknown function [Haloechinothrix alba]
MDESTAAGGTERGERGSPRYQERLYLAWWAWPVPLVLGTSLAVTIHLGYPGLRAWLPYVLVLGIVTAALVLLSRTKVAVRPTESGAVLQVADATLPVRYISGVDVIDRAHKRKALGPELDPAAHLVHRGWVGPVLRVHLDDPNDPTPYWLFSTRRPRRLAELLRAAAQPGTHAGDPLQTGPA